MNASRPQPRTFGDLITHNRTVHWSAMCSFCKSNGYVTPGYKGARKYSTRHYICDDCIEPRKDVVLPAIRRREAFKAKLIDEGVEVVKAIEAGEY
jgi:hypothetical protein